MLAMSDVKIEGTGTVGWDFTPDKARMAFKELSKFLLEPEIKHDRIAFWLAAFDYIESRLEE